MPSVQKCADLLREQANKTLTPQIQALEDELRNLNELLVKGIRGVRNKLESLRNTELPATELILNDYLDDAVRKLDIDGRMLALFTRGLRTKETQEEILASLLDNAVNCFPRVALFTVRGDVFRGWSSRGFSDSTAETISSDELSRDACSWLMKILRNGKQAKSDKLPGTGSLRLMGEESSGAWRFYPLHILGRPVAILLAGKAEDSDGRPEALAALMDCATLRLENIALKILKTLSESSPEIDENSSLTFTSEQQPPVKEREMSVESGTDAAQATPSPRLPASEDDTLHAATKRFAELLVSGIKFYNEHAIAEGRKNRDLYKRLQQSIIRNRKMYEKRVAPAVAEKIDYLHEELVRILADGDAGAFGDGYPGPIIGGPDRIVKF